jgi:hypothetical protein
VDVGFNPDFIELASPRTMYCEEEVSLMWSALAPVGLEEKLECLVDLLDLVTENEERAVLMLE